MQKINFFFRFLSLRMYFLRFVEFSYFQITIPFPDIFRCAFQKREIYSFIPAILYTFAYVF